MVAPWYENGTFDAKYIEAWSAAGRFASTMRDVEALAGALKDQGVKSVLDIPCGFGRFSGALHTLGFEVTGVDLSEDQLAVARRQAPGPLYIQSDMRLPPRGPFDAVCNLFSSFGYFTSVEEDRRALSAWFDVLSLGGLLIVETTHRDQLAAWEANPDSGPSGLDEVVSTNWVTSIREATVLLGTESRVMRMRMYTATELVGLCEEVGFERISVHGDWGREPLAPTNRLFLRARRPG